MVDTEIMRSIDVVTLAKRIGASRAWVTKQARAGEIPGAYKIGNYWRFRLPEVEQYIKQIINKTK
ncbi:MAG: DNA-binding protein [Candidatus Zixiibacteriota bacterium]|nr:MAG: DNA-binding protein [candidate division Zixibacteria bacterium]